ncbi:MAG TPA: molybdenum cofactor biosynthesis protein MoaE [Gemmatimonadaceae bacterium]|nr:molybdenum cofactor biosynthesis protein MoaE [Gemmatimonadaceae bacterium]
MSRVAVVERPLDVAALVAEVSSPTDGAIATFVGVVRDSNAGRPVTGIDYSAYGPMATRELEAIVAEAAAAFGGVRVAVEHRVGTLAVGDASVIIAASHAHRADALGGLGFVIEELKRRVPIWKREHYADGTREWVHAGSSRSAPLSGGVA